MTQIPIIYDTVTTNGQILSTLSLLNQIVDFIPPNGIPIDEMETRLNLKIILSNSIKSSIIELEDEDLATIKSLIVKMNKQKLKVFANSYLLLSF